MTSEVVQNWNDTSNYTITRRRKRWVWGYPGWNPAPDVSVVFDTSSFTKHVRNRTWRRDPQFRLKKTAGVKLLDLPFSFYSQKSSVSSGSVEGPYGYAWDRYQTVYELPTFTVSAPNASDTIDVNEVYAKIVNRVRSESVNVPVFLGEARETASMVHKRATSIVMAALALRRGNVQEFIRQLHPKFVVRPSRRRKWERLVVEKRRDESAFASIWLEARYGWLPFMSEVYSAGQLLTKLHSESEHTYFTASASTKTSRIATSNNVSVIGFGSDGGVTCDARTQVNESVKVVWHYIPSEWNGAGLFGFTNPLEVAWELVPLSFVADWFLPIGNYLSTLDMTSRFVHMGGTVGRMKESTITYFNPRNTLSQEGCAVRGFGNLSATSVSIIRTPLVGVPVPSLASFGFDPKIGAKRAVDAIALMRNIFR